MIDKFRYKLMREWTGDVACRGLRVRNHFLSFEYIVTILSSDTSVKHEWKRRHASGRASPTRAAAHDCSRRRDRIPDSSCFTISRCARARHARTRHAPFTPFKRSILSLSALSAVLFAPESSRISRFARVIGNARSGSLSRLALFVCEFTQIPADLVKRFRARGFFSEARFACYFCGEFS